MRSRPGYRLKDVSDLPVEFTALAKEPGERVLVRIDERL
jgi:hypothetical protein